MWDVKLIQMIFYYIYVHCFFVTVGFPIPFNLEPLDDATVRGGLLLPGVYLVIWDALIDADDSTFGIWLSSSSLLTIIAPSSSRINGGGLSFLIAPRFGEGIESRGIFGSSVLLMGLNYYMRDSICSFNSFFLSYLSDTSRAIANRDLFFGEGEDYFYGGDY